MHGKGGRQNSKMILRIPAPSSNCSIKLYPPAAVKRLCRCIASESVDLNMRRLSLVGLT